MISSEYVEEATDALSEIVTRNSGSDDRRTALINLRVSETTDEEHGSSVAGNGVKLKPNKSSASLDSGKSPGKNSGKKSVGKPSSGSKIVKRRRGRVVKNSYSESNCSSNSVKSGETGNSAIEVLPQNGGKEERKEESPTYDQVFQSNTTSSNLAIHSDLMTVIQPPSTASDGSSVRVRRQSSLTSPKPRIKNYEYEFGEKLTIGNNARVKMMIELFDHSSSEEIEGSFICLKGDLIGVHHRPAIVYVVITSKCLYFLNPIYEHHSIFNLDHSVKLSQMKCLETDVNRLGLVIVHEKSCDRTSYHITTCTGSVSNAIMDILHKTCCRNGLKPPEIVTRKETSKQMMLKCFLSTYSGLDLEDILLIHISTVFWFKSHQPISLMSTFDELSSLSSSYENCSGYKEGMLMYQCVEGGMESDLKCGWKAVKEPDLKEPDLREPDLREPDMREPDMREPDLKCGWKAGYFILKHGFIYCYENSQKSRLIFFSQLYNNRCKGCRRVVAEDENYSLSRPNVIEIKFIGDDHNLHHLFLAIPSEAETTDWIMNILNEIDLNLNDLLGTFDSSPSHNSWEKLVTLLLTEDSILVLVNNQNQSTSQTEPPLETTNPMIASLFKSSLPFTVLGCINISDVIAVYADDLTNQRITSFTFIIIEYENTSSTATMGQGNFKWKLFFVNSIERNLFLDKLSRCWSQLFQVQLQVVHLDESTAGSYLDDDEDVLESRQALERISSWYRDALLNLRDKLDT